jgi:hypothetical protein
MPEMVAVQNQVQFGFESAFGTAVPATKRLNSLMWTPAIKTQAKQQVPNGSKYPTAQRIQRENTEWKIQGDEVAYNELPYLFDLLFGTPAITTPIGATVGRKYAYAPASFAADSRRSATVEFGSATRAFKAPGLQIQALTCTITQEQLDFSGTAIGQLLVDGITLTSSLPDVGGAPVIGDHVNVFLDDTSGGLGGTQLSALIRASWELSEVISPVWYLNRSDNSYDKTVEKKPKFQVKLMLAADSVGMGLLTTMRAGAKKFMRIDAQGEATGEAALHYQYQHDLCLTVADVAEFRDEQGVYAIEWVFDVTHDVTWTKAHSLFVSNMNTSY